MAHRYRRSNNNGTGFLFILIILGIVYVFSLPESTKRQIAAYGITCAVLVLTLVVLIHFWRRQRRLRKLRALSMVDADVMDGLTFEQYVAELLKDQGYKNVKLTERFDYGIDIIATKDGMRWGVQVKRHRNIVKAAAVRQVVTALNRYGCQRAMVVTNSVYSRPAKLLAQDNSCVLIGKDELAKWILKFQHEATK